MIVFPVLSFLVGALMTLIRRGAIFPADASTRVPFSWRWPT